VQQPIEVDVDESQQVVERVAAIDVAKATGMVCTRIPNETVAGRRITKVWEVKATTKGLLELAGHLVAQGIERVVLESTSDYWRPFYYVLEADFEVMLVNPRDAKNVPGRKTDVSDAAWLADLGAHGLLRASFVPPEPIRELRDFPDCVAAGNNAVSNTSAERTGTERTSLVSGSRLKNQIERGLRRGSERSEPAFADDRLDAGRAGLRTRHSPTSCERDAGTHSSVDAE